MNCENGTAGRRLRCTFAARGASLTDVRVCPTIVAILVCAGGGWAESRPLAGVCQAVESRYNGARSLAAHFEQRYHAPGRLPRAESGDLVLRKPGRMRWDYASPAGKTFLCDGKWIWFYSPTARKVEKSPLRETEDFRAPLAFLLGKLDFRREFGPLTLGENAADTVIEARPRTGKLPYSGVEFTIAPDNRIRRLVVTGQDQSVMEFAFTMEQLNANVADAAFRFIAPPGVPVVEVESPGEEEQR
jgi:outer membrane lipoprotein carrier protein